MIKHLIQNEMQPQLVSANGNNKIFFRKGILLIPASASSDAHRRLLQSLKVSYLCLHLRKELPRSETGLNPQRQN